MQVSKGIDMSKENGGPAFPVADPMLQEPANVAEMKRLANGMTLRDYLAAKAMQGLIEYSGQNLPPKTPDRLSAMAYEYADAMIAERAK